MVAIALAAGGIAVAGSAASAQTLLTAPQPTHHSTGHSPKAGKYGWGVAAPASFQVHRSTVDPDEPTLFGTTAPRTGTQTLKSAVDNQRTKYGNLGVVRLYYSGFPDSWAKITPAVSGTPVSVSFKIDPADVLAGTYDTQLLTWFSTAPTDTATYWTYYHEPEDNISAGQFTAAQFRDAFNHVSDLSSQAAAATGAQLHPTLVLMCWTLSKASHRTWTDYYPAAGTEILGWDCYNGGGKKGNYQPASGLLDRAIAVSASVSKPWALPELGSLLVPRDDGTGRAAWIDDVTSYASAHDATFVTYFDSNIGTEYRLTDQPSSDAWSRASAE